VIAVVLWFVGRIFAPGVVSIVRVVRTMVTMLPVMLTTWDMVLPLLVASDRKSRKRLMSFVEAVGDTP
jgi:hypothetical protein